MRVVVLGAGVIGVTSAYYLACAGHEVTVIERHAGAAQETSFANAGQLSTGYSTPWAAPGMPFKAIKWLLQKQGPLAIRLDGSWFQWQWMFQMLRHCNARSYAINKSRMLRLADYSRHCLRELRDATGITYEGRQQGTLQVFRTQQQFDQSARDIAVLREAGIAHTLLSARDLTTIEPALVTARVRLSGGLHLPDDETGDCRAFTLKLAQRAQDLGVQFQYQTEVTHLDVVGGRIHAVHTCAGVGRELRSARIVADTVVVALASFSASLLRDIVALPIYPVKGYSITAAVASELASPISTVLDETYKVAITRFDQRIRVGGMANIVGFNTALDMSKGQTLWRVLSDLFPQGAHLAGDDALWAGLRPMTPDGTPIVGPTAISGLWLNTGHGTLGWTMACGSASLIADLISSRPPAIAFADLALARYQR